METGQTQCRTINDRFARTRSNWRNWNRRLFVSPLEIQFVRIMHGHILTIPFIKSKRTGFCLTFMWRGKILRREFVRHQVRAGKLYVDFAVVTPYYKKGIELYGRSAHMDIVRDQEREDYLKARGWSIMYVTAKRMRDPHCVFVETMRFLRS